MSFRLSSTLGRLLLVLLAVLAIAPVTRAQGSQIIYDDALENGWQNYGWATLNYSNASPNPVHTGTDSISVAAGGYQALYVHHAAFDSTPYSALTFWINGGTTGGQTLQVQAELNGVQQASYAVPAPAANTWHQVTIPLTTLGVANQSNLDGFWIQNTSGSAIPTFYVDDITLVGNTTPLPTSANLSVNAGQPVRTLDGGVYGLNTAIWDSNLGTQTSISLLGQMQTQILRFPGGSASDSYDWTTNRSDGNTWAWSSSFGTFAMLAQAAQAQACITVNYGSGTPEMAAAWVAYANGSPTNSAPIGVDAYGRDWKTVGYWAALRAAAPLATDDGENFLRLNHPAPFGFHDWEIGNECYGSWENDQHGVAQSNGTTPLTGARWDPYTYAEYAAQFYQQMKAVDPTIQVGVVGIDGEDAYGDGQHAVPNPNEAGALHSGWTPVVLATLKSLNVTPNFLIYHRYPEAPGSESDYGLLHNSGTGWAAAASSLRQMLTDYIGASGSGVTLLATENNSVYGNPGKQSVSLVNGLYYADSIGSLAQTEFDGLLWWDFRNGSSSSNNNSASLYGWRLFGDYGIVASGDRSDTPVNTPYPTFYAAKMLTHWARGGDTIVSATTDDPRLAVYAAKLQSGSLALLVINKDPVNDLTGHIALTGFTPGSSTATVYQYGKPQDLANSDLTQSTITDAGTAFDALFPSYSMSVILLKPQPLPTVATAAAATPAPVTGTQASVSVLGAYSFSEAYLIYTWAATGPASVTFSPNGSNAAKNATATFAAAGSYTLTVTIKDPVGHTVQSAVTVTVQQTPTSLTVSPASVTLAPGATKQFTAVAKDQFGATLTSTITSAPTWSVSSGGTISSAGLFTASSAPGGPFTVTAAQGAASATAAVSVAAPAPISTIRYAPRVGWEQRMVGGQFQGSNDGTSYVTLYTVASAPPAGQWTSVTLPLDLSQYRFLRYLAPDGAYGNVAEVEFDGPSGKLTGTGFGTAGSWSGDGNVFSNALDGDLSTFFDAPAPGNGDFVGIDRGAGTGGTTPTGMVRYAPRVGWEQRMVGGQFQGSNDDSAWTTLATVTATPTAGQWSSLSIPDPAAYRYLRYLAPDGAYGNVADIEFDSNSVKLTGTGFGTAGSWSGDGNVFSNALDGDLSTFFDAPAPGNGDFVGIDRGAGTGGAAPVTSTIRYAPRVGWEQRMVGGQFQGSTDGTSYVTLDTVASAPPAGQWTSVTLPLDLSQYRYLRYLAPDGAYGNVAEVEFDGPSGKLTGTGFGTAGSWSNDGNVFGNALDGDLSTFFDAPAPGNGDFVGIQRY